MTGPIEPRYDGEDTRLTSQKEISGWLSYGWAAEVFVVCGVGSFLPITLEQLAREQGVLLADRKTPCGASLGIPLPTQPGLNSTVEIFKSHKNEQCIVNFLGTDINTASFAMYTFSFSVLIQSLVIISMSGAADHGRFRKSLLLIFAFTGAIATMLFLPITSNIYLLGALLAVISNTCFGASFVLLNSFLPLLVRHHPSLQARPVVQDDSTQEDPPAHDVELDARASLLRSSTPKKVVNAQASPELLLSTRISSNGIAIGYIAAFLVQVLAVFIVYSTGSSTFSLRLVLFMVGAWWFVFTIPSALWLRPRPGPPLHVASQSGKGRLIWLSYIAHSWRSLGRTISRARRLKDILLFLGAWFLLSDAIATVSGTAVLFAKVSLNMNAGALALINVVVMISGVLGALSWAAFSRLFSLSPSQTILVCLGIFELIPLYALLGYIPAIQRMGVVGLQQPWEMYPLAAVYGLVMGGLSSYCRSLFGELIPPGNEAAFYALYAITDKGSSIFGPAIVGAITDATGDIRPAFWFLAALIALPFPLMYLVDVDRGRREGADLAKVFRALNGEEEDDDNNDDTSAVRNNTAYASI